jgi:hypothetical protein
MVFLPAGPDKQPDGEAALHCAALPQKREAGEDMILFRCNICNCPCNHHLL